MSRELIDKWTNIETVNSGSLEARHMTILESKWKSILHGDVSNAKSMLIEPFMVDIINEHPLIDKWKSVSQFVVGISDTDKFTLSKQLEELKSECEAAGKNSDNIFSILLMVLVESYEQDFNSKIRSVSWLYKDFCSIIDYDVVMKDLNSYYVLDGICELKTVYVDILKERFKNEI